jgi:hypothetical protein
VPRREGIRAELNSCICEEHLFGYYDCTTPGLQTYANGMPTHTIKKLNQTPWSPRENYTDERTPFDGEVSANFLRMEGDTWSA